MNEHTLRVLEYDRLREIVAGFAASGPGSEAVLAARPATDRSAVELLLGETQEFLRVLERGEAPPMDGIRDIRSPLAKVAAAGMMLSPAELLDIAATLGAGRRIKYFVQRLGKQTPPVPLFSEKADRITPLPPIEEAVQRAIDEKGEVKDSASPALRRIRRQISRTRDEVLERLGLSLIHI